MSGPQGSAPSFSATSGPNVSFTPDIVGDYIVALTVDDGTSADTSTILLSSSPTGPVAVAGSDLVLPADRIISVDAGASLRSDTVSASYLWSVLGLGTEGAVEAVTIATPLATNTTISFETLSAPGLIAGRNLITNGSFETHGTLINNGWGSFETIEGWTSPVGVIEVQERNFGTGNKNENAVVELDANFNSTIATNVVVETAGEHTFSLDYAKRGIPILLQNPNVLV